jgi:hypothetical protein
MSRCLVSIPIGRKHRAGSLRHVVNEQELEMPRMVAPDDLHEDMLVTVLAQDAMPFTVGLMGVPLRVISFELPYIYCAILEQVASGQAPEGCERGPVVLDHRQVELMHVGERVVERYRAFRGRSNGGEEPPGSPVDVSIPF